MATSAQPIGIVFPITHGPSGYFNQSYDIIEQVKANITMLLKTKKGERRMSPDFGSGLWSILFEMNDENLAQIAESTIRRDVERWLPYVNIESVLVRNGTTERNQYAMGVSVKFTLNSAGISTPQTLELSVQQGNL
jgi:phage baseplate assembly protein W